MSDLPLTYSFFHKDTGVIHDMTLTTSDPAIAQLNIPPDHLLLPGVHDHLSCRVDLVTGKTYEYQPSAPSDHHVWHAETKRWVHGAHAAAQHYRLQTARAAIVALEAKSPSYARALALGKPGALNKLAQLDKDIEAQQAIVEEVEKWISTPVSSETSITANPAT